MKPLLIAYYSRSGYTRRVAQALAQDGHADLEEVRPLRGYDGLRGLARAIFDTLLRRQPPLEPLRHCPADYQTVLVGGPVWAGRMAPPVRSFVADFAPGFKRMAAFCTMGGRGGEGVLDALAGLAGKPLAWRAALTDAEIDSGAFLERAAGARACLQGPPPAPQRSPADSHPVP